MIKAFMRLKEEVISGRRWSWLIALTGVMAVALILLVTVVPAQAIAYGQVPNWSQPILVTQGASRPEILTDGVGNLHVFYVEATGANSEAEGNAINYTWRIHGQWIPPVDILYAAGDIVNLVGAVVDGQGYLHVAWADGDTVYHSTAHVDDAGNALGWHTESIQVGTTAQGDMVMDEKGRLHLALRTDFFSIEYQFSDDLGKSWSRTQPVEGVLDREEYALSRPRLAVDGEGTLHMTWYRTAQQVDWNDWSVWYGRSSDQGNSWQLTEMVDGEYGGSNIMVDSDGNIHLVYGRPIGKPDGRWHRWSSDGGSGWSQPQALYPGVEHASGQTGGFDFAFDGDGRLHMVDSYGNKSGDASTWHFVWQGSRWSQPEMLLDTSYHAHYPRLAAALGNELIFMATSARAANEGLFARTAVIDARAAAAETIPAPPQGAGEEETELSEASLEEPSVSVPRIVLSEEARAAPPTEAPFDSLLIAVGAAALVILVAVLIQLRAKNRKR